MRRALRGVCVAGALAAASGLTAQERELSTSELLLRSGRYDEALAMAETAADLTLPSTYRDLTRALERLGRLGEAESAARVFERAHPTSADLANRLGELLEAQGRLDEAEEAFGRAIDGHASDTLVARANLADLRSRRGDHAGAEVGYRVLIEAYNSGAALSADELIAVGRACRGLGASDPQLHKDALRALDDALDRDPGNLAARIEIGNLFLEKYNGTDARAEFETVLALNPRDPAALLGMARALDFVGERGVLGRVRESLEIHPRYLPARVYLAELLVALERYDEAVSEAETALEQNPALLPALAVLAGARFLQGDDAGFVEAKRRALELSSAPAEFFTTLSELCVRNRLYAEAAGFAKRAVELDPRYSAGHAALGLNELRLGRIDAGRASLEASFSGDPYNVWVKNTLDLLDTFRGYRTERGNSFELFILEREAAVLTPYVEALASEALEELTGRYGFTPQLPIRIEVYSSHADFSVRTVGLAGLGALGVCFGNVLALDSPSARPVGAFNWGSTLWHELAHSVTMGMTEHRVPRWLTEGISVYEERRARPGWGDDLSLQFLAAFKAEQLLPIAELNDGFVRPSNPQQVGLSYYQASLVVEMIERDHGFEALLALLEGYRMRRSTDQLFADVLDMDLEQFDALFEAYLRERFGEPLAAIHMREAPSRSPTRAQLVGEADERPDDFIAQLSAGAALFRAKDKARAQAYLERASRLFPGYAEADGPHWLLAQLNRDSGDVAEAIQALERQVAVNENHLEAHLLLAELLEQKDRLPRAAEVLEAALYIDPFSAELHEWSARLAEASGRPERAVLGRQTLVDLDPVDLPEAFYRLALAKRGVGDAAGARVAVLRALELAPRFQRAQQLLLELHRQRGGGAS